MFLPQFPPMPFQVDHQNIRWPSDIPQSVGSCWIPKCSILQSWQVKAALQHELRQRRSRAVLGSLSGGRGGSGWKRGTRGWRPFHRPGELSMRKLKDGRCQNSRLSLQWLGMNSQNLVFKQQEIGFSQQWVGWNLSLHSNWWRFTVRNAATSHVQRVNHQYLGMIFHVWTKVPRGGGERHGRWQEGAWDMADVAWQCLKHQTTRTLNILNGSLWFPWNTSMYKMQEFRELRSLNLTWFLSVTGSLLAERGILSSCPHCGETQWPTRSIAKSRKLRAQFHWKFSWLH